jgi:serine/threonine protein kinase
MSSHHCWFSIILSHLRPLFFNISQIYNVDDVGRVKEEKAVGITFMDKLSVCTDVAKALRFLHNMGHVHRDVKSHNILLFDEKPCTRAKLCDLGTVVRKPEVQNPWKGGRERGRERGGSSYMVVWGEREIIVIFHFFWFTTASNPGG